MASIGWRFGQSLASSWPPRLLPRHPRPMLADRDRERHCEAEGRRERAERAEIAFDDLEAHVGEAGEGRKGAVGEDHDRRAGLSRALREIDGERRIGREAD